MRCSVLICGICSADTGDPGVRGSTSCVHANCSGQGQGTRHLLVNAQCVPIKPDCGHEGSRRCCASMAGIFLCAICCTQASRSMPQGHTIYLGLDPSRIESKECQPWTGSQIIYLLTSRAMFPAPVTAPFVAQLKQTVSQGRLIACVRCLPGYCYQLCLLLDDEKHPIRSSTSEHLSLPWSQ